MTQTYSVVEEEKCYLHFYNTETDKEETDIYVTYVWRNGQSLDLMDHEASCEGQYYLLSQDEIYSLLQPGDVVENNYCHGLYLVVFE